MDVEHATGTVGDPDVDDDGDRNSTRNVTIRPADGERDAFYLAHLWSCWFGTEYEHGHRYTSGKLPHPLFPVAGWETEDMETNHLDAYGVVDEHDPPDCAGRVHVGGGLVTIETADRSVEELPEGGFDANALVGDRNAWLWLIVVDDAWRGLGLGRRVFDAQLRWARDQDADMALAYGWEHGGRTSRPLFEGYDFVPVERFERLYEGERDVCPDCGVWPSDDRTCRCPGVVWAKDL